MTSLLSGKGTLVTSDHVQGAAVIHAAAVDGTTGYERVVWSSEDLRWHDSHQGNYATLVDVMLVLAETVEAA